MIMSQSIFKRHSNEPLLKPSDMPIEANAVFNPGAVEVGGEVILLLRIEDQTGISQIRVARSANGVDGWKIADKPLLEPDLPQYPYEEWGCEDARVTQIRANEWIIAYTAYSRYGPAVALALTSDFEEAERLGIMLSPTNKDATVLPEKLRDSWFMLHRPVTGSEEDIWYASSPTMVNWSQPGILMAQRGGPWWDSVRIGVGGPPLKTDDGWLLIYHGVKKMGVDSLYRLGLAMLDKDDPRKVLLRASRWIFAPEAPFEMNGLLPNVVFTCGAIVRGDEVWMYYGAADTFVGLATAKLSELVDFVKRHDFLCKIKPEKGMMR